MAAVVAVAGIAWGAQALAQTPTGEAPTEPPAEATATEALEPTATEPEAPVATATTGEAAETPPADEPSPAAETPAGTPPGGEPVISVVVPDDELEEGDTFDAEVRIDNAERIAAFSFGLVFDPEHLSVPDQDPNVDDIQFGDAIGEFLDTGERPKNCDEPRIDEGNNAVMVCVTNNPAVCAGGAMGVSGSGRLGVVQFEVIGTGDTQLSFDEEDTSVVLDDFVPCESEQPIQVRPQTEGATVNVSGDSFPWLLVLGGAAIVLAIGAGGAFAYMRWRGRSTGGTSEA
jgi:hypothetical protein